MSEQYTQAPDIKDVEFQRSAVDKLYKTGGLARGINPARIERVRDEVDFLDVVTSLVDASYSDMISCPFHGTDSRPSFHTKGGFGWCYGCPPGQQYYDQIRFAQKALGISWYQALRWLEKEYNLPAMPDVVDDDDGDEEITAEVFFPDLQETFFDQARRDCGETKDEGLFEEYALIYFSALEQETGAEEARKAREFDEASKMRVRAAKMLARVMGQAKVNRILDKKVAQMLKRERG